METRSIRANEISREWFIVDAEGQTLGRLASEIAQIIRGKRNPFSHLTWIWAILLLLLMRKK